MRVDAELFGDALPTYLTRFVGRAGESADLTAMLGEPGLVTVCGIGGAGKTRLAVEVAREARTAGKVADVYWVPLVTAGGPGEVLPAVGKAVGLEGTPAKNPRQISSLLGSGPALLVLDNCEHVATGCRDLLDTVLLDCPELRVLTTSRIPLSAAGEQIYAIPPLGGSVADDSYTTDATALFVERARATAPTYALTELNGPIVVEICQALSGLPLAIELAASWIRVLSPGDLLASLRHAQAALESDSALVEDRHRSIQAVLDNTWQWLGESDRSVIEALSVFVGGFTREAAEAVAGADLGTLSRLSELALLQRMPDDDGGSRYQVHELVRSYGVERSRHHAEIRDRHLRYFLDQAFSLGIWSFRAIEVTESVPLAADLANLDAALAWALDSGRAEDAQQLAVALDHFWPLGALSYEHRMSRLQAALALPGPPSDTAALARAHALMILCRIGVGIDPEALWARYREAIKLFRQVGDAVGVAAIIRDRAAARLLQGDLQGCRRDILDSLARCRRLKHDLGIAWCLVTLGWAAVLEGDYGEAITQLREARAIFSAYSRWYGTFHCDSWLALAHQLRGEWIESIDACQRALDLQRQWRLMASYTDLLQVVARLCVEQGRWLSAARLHGAADGWSGDYDHPSWLPTVASFGLSAQARTKTGARAWTAAYDSCRQLHPDRAHELVEDVLVNLRQELVDRAAGLSSREIEVLRLVAAGLTDGAIADQLVVSPRTIHAHLRSSYQKLGVTSRTAAVHAAAGIVAPPGSVRG